jgi:addiction module HigA family antidote
MAKRQKARFVPAEAFLPGEFIREELEARGKTQADLARVLGRPLQSVNQIINGRKAITARTEVELALAFGTSPEVWLNLETAYQLSRARKNAHAAIAKRAAAMAFG